MRPRLRKGEVRELKASRMKGPTIKKEGGTLSLGGEASHH